ncbi:hypothetical protein AVEN_1414-1 [Araneus ventricosus]|uniref:Uncharacterized protein n=1 Tax=Araneus ventricosus TaxID=182803 RepID=A0A4Y2SWE7_ARAVE|nr:hypothetical protein AVEN_1414-1 [Araneus ventricosus]
MAKVSQISKMWLISSHQKLDALMIELKRKINDNLDSLDFTAVLLATCGQQRLFLLAAVTEDRPSRQRRLQLATFPLVTENRLAASVAFGSPATRPADGKSAAATWLAFWFASVFRASVLVCKTSQSPLTRRRHSYPIPAIPV